MNGIGIKYIEGPVRGGKTRHCPVQEMYIGLSYGIKPVSIVVPRPSRCPRCTIMVLTSSPPMSFPLNISLLSVFLQTELALFTCPYTMPLFYPLHSPVETNCFLILLTSFRTFMLYESRLSLRGGGHFLPNFVIHWRNNLFYQHLVLFVL